MFKGHRLEGNASYYSASLDGSKTANGETYRAGRYSAAHLTLPLGCWIEVKSRATGRVIQLKVNDRGPYTGGFVLDLSRAAARFLGVDVAADRQVDIRVIAMPGEKPPEKDAPETTAANTEEGAVSSASK
jgi:rare lipoprotein A